MVEGACVFHHTKILINGDDHGIDDYRDLMFESRPLLRPDGPRIEGRIRAEMKCDLRGSSAFHHAMQVNMERGA